MKEEDYELVMRPDDAKSSCPSCCFYGGARGACLGDSWALRCGNRWHMVWKKRDLTKVEVSKDSIGE